jgi:hypothetical protein
MKKNYNYNYVNRVTAQKPSIEITNLDLCSCTSSVLKKAALYNGRLWHTTDTNEFYYDWDNKRNKLNVSGDNATISAEIEKLKSDVAKLNPEHITSLETKVNNAVSTVNNLKTSVNTAVTKANNAAQTAQNAAAQVANKVNASDLAPVATSGSYSDLTGKPNLNNYAKKTDLNDLATESWVEGKGYLTQHQSLSAYAKKTDIPDISGLASKSEIPDVSNFATKSEIPDVSDFATKSEIPSVEGLASEEWVKGKGYLTEHQDISGKADRSELPSKVSELTNDAGYLTSNDLPDFLTDSDLPDVSVGSFPADVEGSEAGVDGFATVQDVIDYVNALIEKKKDELAPVGGKPYLYTNGYKLGDTATELTDPVNGYEIVLDGNGVFEIELLHKNEKDGYADPDDIKDSEPGNYFKVILPTGYSLTTYVWDEENSVYVPSTTGNPGMTLVAETVTPDNVTYYYKDAIDYYFWGGAHFDIEASINQYHHLIKVVVTKNN